MVDRAGGGDSGGGADVAALVGLGLLVGQLRKSPPVRGTGRSVEHFSEVAGLAEAVQLAGGWCAGRPARIG